MPENASAQNPPSAFPSLSRSMLDIPRLQVSLAGRSVGTLALADGVTAFEYEEEWLAEGFALNPFSLPLEPRVFVAKPHPLDGMFGVFDDSLPDGWGRLLVDRFLREQGQDPHATSGLARLALVGESGMGALEYKPQLPLPQADGDRTLDQLAKECAQMLATDFSEDLDTLFALGGSSGGARPKIFTNIDGEEWIVKFPSSMDPGNIGATEFAIAQAASTAGIEMPEVRLLPSELCSGYFAIKRFDRSVNLETGESYRLHMASAGALLETSHRLMNLDYDLLIKLTLLLTNSMEQVEAMFRLMVFNVAVGNRDDHAKNFSFLRGVMRQDDWRVSPGYDLTVNAGINGERATTVNGKGRGIGVDDVLAVGKRAGLSAARTRAIVAQVREAVNDQLSSILTPCL